MNGSIKDKCIKKMKSIFSDFWTALLWAFILLIVMAGVLWISNKLQLFNDIPSSESLIITFIGILATFVVVSNFSQVSNIEQKVDNKITAMEKSVDDIFIGCLDKDDDTSLLSQIQKIQANLEKLKEDGEFKSPLTIKDEVKNEMRQDLQNDINQAKQAAVDEIGIRSLQMLKFANAMINSEHKEILQNLLKDVNCIFRITHLKNGKMNTNKARIVANDGAIQFVSETGKTIFTNVSKINGKNYNPEEIDMALIYIIEAMRKTGTYDRTNSDTIKLGDEEL